MPQWIFVPALAVGLIPIARRASSAAPAGMPFSIEMLMTIAATGAMIIGAAEEAVPLDAYTKAKIDGFNGECKTVSVLVAGNLAVGLIAIRDEPREDAIAGLAELKAMGISTLMLTGDNARTAEAIGKGLGIEVRAGLLPDDKQRIVRQKQAEGQVVAKVGDGINDAPTLAAADIGIAMGGSTDVALETADAAVLHGRVKDIANLVRLSQATMAISGRTLPSRWD